MRYKIKKNTIRFRKVIRGIISRSKDTFIIYNDAAETILKKCIAKKIQFDQYYRKKWGISPSTVFNFEMDFFKDQKKRDLYIFLAALSDCEIFEELKSVWKNEKHEELCGQILHREIYSLQEQGITI